MKYSEEKLADAYQALRTVSEKGLTGRQVAEIQKQKGLNKFEEEKKNLFFISL